MATIASNEFCLCKTAKGTRCSRKAFKNELYCRTHLKVMSKSKINDREIKEIIYHNHAPSDKFYKDCPRCKQGIKQKELSSSFLQGLKSLQIGEQTQLCEKSS